MAQRGRPKGDRIIIAVPRGKPGRPRFKPCASPGCGHQVKPGFRYCGLHGGQILQALRKSPEYLTFDRQWHPEGNGGRADVMTDW
jgi:hypothetical protein